MLHGENDVWHLGGGGGLMGMAPLPLPLNLPLAIKCAFVDGAEFARIMTSVWRHGARRRARNDQL